MVRSFGSSTTSTSSASGSTATVAVEVWMRPCDSVAGTRCTRCTPDSHLNSENAPSPAIEKVMSFMPPESDGSLASTWCLKPRRSA